MRRFRRIIDVAVPVLGTGIVFLAVTLISDINLLGRILTVLAGVLMIQAGVWKLTTPFMPSTRRFTELRREVDGFVPLVRTLNGAALEAQDVGTEEAWVRFRGATDAMHLSVDRMAELAGKVMGAEPTEVPSPGGA